MTKKLGWSLLLLQAVCSNTGDTSFKLTVDTLPSGTVEVSNRLSGVGDFSPQWSLRPLVRIGSVDGPDVTNFGQIVDVALGPAGSVYVLDAQSANVRVFDETGSYLQAIGRRGRGPGELASPYSITFDDRRQLWVADGGNRRYTVFSRSGVFVTGFRSPIRGGAVKGQLRVSDGKLWDFGFVIAAQISRNGFDQRRPGLAALGFTVDSAVAAKDTILLGHWTPRGLKRDVGGEVLTAVPPHGPRRVQAPGLDGTVWVGTGDRYEVHQLNPSGDTVRTVTLDAIPTPLSAKHAADLDDWVRARVIEGFEFDRSVLPSNYPFFVRLTVADDGHLWICRDAGDDASSFDVFSAQGRFQGTVLMEPSGGSCGVDPHIKGNRLVGVAVDALGVQYVQLYEIVKLDR